MRELKNSDEQIDYQWHNRQSLPPSVLEECARLFSNHYGTWSFSAQSKPGQKISLSSDRLQEWIAPDGTSVSLAYHKGELIGHAFSLRREIEHIGWITWVTQLVVHKDWRKRGIGTKLLNAIWAFSDDFARGLVTANPFTVRALERATRRRCNPKFIRKHLDKLYAVAATVNYAKNSKIAVTDVKSVIDTKFHIDHSDLKNMLKLVAPRPPKLAKLEEGQKSMLKPLTPRRWKLGKLEEGQEWLAFTFREQPRKKLTREELDSLFEQSEQVWEAYSRMRVNGGHHWAKHATHETDWILQQAFEGEELRIVDFGCGIGRHAVEFAKRGHSVVGVDFLPTHLDRAKQEATDYKNVRFELGDCRDVDVGTQFDLGLALYDVIGSFPKDTDNQRILENLSRHVRKGGLVVLSVMNFYLTRATSKLRGDVYKKPRLLEKLKPGDIMQRTGDIFDPDFYLLDTASRVVYRKEQFQEDGLLSAELVIRDRRYGSEEVIENCRAVGLETIDCRYVQAGGWDRPLERDSKGAKEILYVGRKL